MVLKEVHLHPDHHKEISMSIRTLVVEEDFNHPWMTTKIESSMDRQDQHHQVYKK